MTRISKGSVEAIRVPWFITNVQSINKNITLQKIKLFRLHFSDSD